jgi:hypothetical protein
VVYTYNALKRFTIIVYMIHKMHPQRLCWLTSKETSVHSHMSSKPPSSSHHFGATVKTTVPSLWLEWCKQQRSWLAVKLLESNWLHRLHRRQHQQPAEGIKEPHQIIKWMFLVMTSMIWLYDNGWRPMYRNAIYLLAVAAGNLELLRIWTAKVTSVMILGPSLHG